jgi:hypothetical protein
VRRLFPALVLLASCDALEPFERERGGGSPELKASALEAFERWRLAAVQGRSEEVFHGLSLGNKSKWLFERLQEGDSLTLDWRAGIAGTTARTDLDLWWGLCKDEYRKSGEPRVTSMPDSVHLVLVPLWNRLFALQQGAVRAQMERVQAREVYADNTGATVAVQNGAGTVELYGMVVELDGWKIDHQRQPLGPRLR